MSSTTIPLAALSRGDLETLAERLLAENAALQQAVAELRAEVAQLKGVKGRPKIKPSGMEKGPEPEPTDKAMRRGDQGENRPAIRMRRRRSVAPGGPCRGRAA